MTKNGIRHENRSIIIMIHIRVFREGMWVAERNVSCGQIDLVECVKLVVNVFVVRTKTLPPNKIEIRRRH